MKNKFWAFALLMITNVYAFSQLSVTTQTNATVLAQSLAGQNISVTNATLLGAPQQAGYFTYTGSQLETPSGVIMSTGDINNALGPNNSGSTSSPMGQPGDDALTELAGYTTNDRVELKFDFQVQSDYVEFSYIFASEEYNEFVNSSFNDVFAFYISGPGIIGEQNLAVVPTTNTPVTINSINLSSFWQFYRNNENGILTNDVEFDGYTVQMKASKSGLIPCSTYTLRLVIADVSDSSYDSWVLLAENSLIQGEVGAITTTPTADNTALEGCIKAQFTFQLEEVLTYDIPINYEILGTAINGVDYITIDNQLVIPAGQTSATIIIDAIADGLLEDQETIQLVFRPSPCEPLDTISLFIDDAQPIDFSLTGTDLTCAGNFSGQIDATISGGFQPYVLSVTNSNNQTTNLLSTDLPLTGLAAGTYTVAVDDIYGCNGDSQVVGAQFDAGQTFLPDGNGEVYTSSLEIAGLGSAVLTNPNQLQSLCLNMEHSALGEVEIKLIAPNGTTIILKERFNNSDGGHTNLGEPCAKGPVDGGNSDITPGVGYDYCFTNSPLYGTMVDEQSNYSYTYTDLLGEVLTDNYLPSGSYTPYQSFSNLIGTPLAGTWTIWVKDHNPQDNGYIFNWSISFNNANSGDVVIINEPEANVISNTITSPACGENTGAINISVAGPNGPFTFFWSNAETTEDISNLEAGVYKVTVTNSESCTTIGEFGVSNATGPVVTGIVSNETCENASDGAIDLSATGTIISYSWSNGANTQDISGLSPGNYTVIVTEQNGCISSKSFTVIEAVPMSVSSVVTNEICGNMEGEINLNVSGGTGNYTYLWSNASTNQDLTDLVQNTYTVTVTDENNCIKIHSAEVINLVGQCFANCDLEINNADILQETCGNGDGAINLSVFSSNTPVLYQWNNGENTPAITNLNSGTFTITISDAADCSLVESYTIVNNSGSMLITNPVIVNDNCGNHTGSINITVTGGVGTKTYLWDNGAITEDLSGLSSGTYSVTVTDQSNCKVYASFNIINQTSTMSLTFQYVMNENCNNNNGSIDINLSTGNYTYLWSNGSTSQDLTNLSAGNYTCTITQTPSGCILVTPVYTVQNIAGSLSVDVVDIDHEYCNQGNGEIQIEVDGGVAPYTYLWSNGSTATNLYNLSEGNYICTVSDATGCSLISPIISILNTPGSLSVNATVTEEICDNNAGNIDLIVSGGTEPVLYSWSNGQTTQDITNLSSGNYTYTISDANQCSTSSSVYVPHNSGSLAITTAEITNTICGLSDGAIDITVTGGNGTYTFAWSNGITTADNLNISAGIYTVTVSDESGCFLIQTFDVDGELFASNANITGDMCNSNSGAIDLTVTGGSLLTYVWSNGAQTEDLQNLGAGEYSVHVSSFEGCILDSTFTIGSSTDCFTMCISDYSTIESGIIYDSGGASGNYSNGENCSFLIEPYCANTVVLTFTSFNTQQNYDFLKVYDGHDATGVLLGTFSGSTVPATITANSGAAFLKFTSNSATSYSGFAITWSTQLQTAAPNGDFTVSNSNPALGASVNFTCTDNNADEWSWDVDNNGTTDFTSQSVSHIYNSPGTYTVSLTSINCLGSTTTSQQIVVQDAPEISLSTLSATEYIISTCDDLITHTFTISNTGSGDLNWTGTNGSFLLSPSSGTITAGNSQLVTVIFPAMENSGIHTFHNTITSNDPLNVTVTDTVTINQVLPCTHLLCSNANSEQMSGVLYDSGGATGNYSFNQNCSFLINPDCAESVTISFSSFSLENSFDKLYIYDGIDQTGTLLVTLTGTSLPAPVTASSGKMFLRFTSDGTVNSSGFAANWTTQIQTESPNAVFTVSDLNPAIGTIVNFENSESNSSSWAWDVDGDGTTDYTTQYVDHNYNAAGSYVVTLTVTNCIGSETTTQTVLVQGAPSISLSTSTASEYTISACGSSITHNFTIYNTGMGDLVWSGTNGSYALIPSSGTIATGGSQLITVNVPSEGSAAIYTHYNVITSNDPINPSVTDTIIINQTVSCFYLMCNNTSSEQFEGSLSDSGGTGGNYSNNQNCEFLIQPECVDSITLSFASFNTQLNYDILRVYDGADDSGILLGTFSGSTVPEPVTAYSGIMFLKFSSNSSTSYPGFVANWTSEIISAPPSALFSVSDLNPALGTSVNFSNSDENVISWEWDIDGDATADYFTQNITHAYEVPGSYVVSLTATNCYGSNTTTQTIVVQGEPEISLSTTTATSYTISTCGNSISHSFTISNNGTGNLIWTGTNGAFSLLPSSGTILPGEDQIVNVTFNSFAYAGVYNYYNTISSNDPVNQVVKDTVIIEQTIDCLNLMCSNTSTTQESGTISDSGGLSGNYSNNQNCGFLIQPACADSIILNFTNFSTQSNYDFVKVYDGSDASGTLLGSFSGLTIPAPVSASSGQMYIQFLSNANTTNSGFAANWHTVLATGIPSADFIASDLNPALGSSVIFTHSDNNASEWAWDVDGNSIIDYTTQNIEHTYISPGTYEVSLTTSNCFGSSTTTQTLVVQGAPQISLSPITATNYEISDCDGSVQHSFTISNTGTGDLVWSGTNGAYTLEPSSGTIMPGDNQTVTITFPGFDFSGVYTFYNTITSNDPVNSSVTDTVIINQTISCLDLMCNSTSSSALSGTLTDSGGLTGYYSNNQNCGFLIDPICADEITLTFSVLGTQLNFDYVSVYDGSDATGTLLGIYSGATLPSPVTAFSGKMYIMFTSNSNSISYGFVAHWETQLLSTAPTAEFTVSNSNPVIGAEVEFNNTDDNAEEWAWDIDGDGTTDYTTQTFTHVYTAPGTYTVSLTATNCLGANSTEQTVVASGAPIISLTPDMASEYSLDNCEISILHTFTIYNTGTQDLIWNGSNGVYDLTPSSGTILPEEEQLVTVSFPSLLESGVYTYHNSIASNDPVHPIVVDSVIINQTVPCPVEIFDNTALKQYFICYPNPAKNVITLEWNLETSEMVVIEIFDVIGKSICKFDEAGFGQKAIDISNYTDGMYLIKYRAGTTEKNIKFVVGDF